MYCRVNCHSTLTAVFLAKVVENYQYIDEDYGDDGDEKMDVPRSAIEWFDARTRRRRDTDHSLSSQNAVNYEVCVRYGLYNLVSSVLL